MEIYLNSMTGLDTAIVSLFESKRHLTREQEMNIRREVLACSNLSHDGITPFGAITHESEQLRKWMKTLRNVGSKHITLLRFVNLSFTVYGLHRGGQDDWDSHARRFDNRIVRASTRLADFKDGETSDFYKGKILTTDQALRCLGVNVPEEIEHDGKTFVKAVNGYIQKGLEDNRDVKRGLYNLAIPSNFVFDIQLTEFAHVYKMRNKNGTANPEVQDMTEEAANQLESVSLNYFDRELLDLIPN